MARKVSLAFNDWPETDQVMWRQLIAPGGPLDDAGALSHLRQTTLAALRAGYDRWLGWIVKHHAEAVSEDPWERASKERLLDWLEDLSALSPHTRHSCVQRTIIVLSAARPDLDWGPQRRIMNGVERLARRARSLRKVGRVLPSGTLFAAGERLVNELAAKEPTALTQALAIRDGAMVALLALLPMRRRSFSELALGSSVQISDDRIQIILSPEMTKNGQPWEAPVPQVAEAVLRRYVDDVRPWLMARWERVHDMLWVDRCGQPLGSHGITTAVGVATARTVGVRVSPHLFRDAAATTLSRLSPENARLIRPLLAHSGFGTAERHYIQAQGIETGRDYAAVLAELMEDK